MGPAARPHPPRLLHWPPVARSSVLASLPRFHRGGFWLLVIAAAASALLADHPLADTLTLNLRFTELALWQPLTAIALYPDGQLGGLIGTLFIQWFIGGQVEERWGTARYLMLVLASALFGYLVVALLGLAVPQVLAAPMGGTLPADIAAVAAFGVLHARQPVQLFGALPLSGRGLAVLVTALVLLGPLLRGNWPVAVPTAVAALCGLLLAWRWRAPPSSGKVAARTGRRPRHLKVVDKPRLLN